MERFVFGAYKSIQRNVYMHNFKITYLHKTSGRAGEGYKVFAKKYYKNRFWVVRTTGDIFRMYKEWKNFASDVLYVHQLSNALRALPLKYLLKVPFVFNAHGSSIMEINAFSKTHITEKSGNPREISFKNSGYKSL